MVSVFHKQPHPTETHPSATSKVDEAGAVSAEHPTNPLVIRENRGKREPRPIRVENFARTDAGESGGGKLGILPSGSRESTPPDEDAKPPIGDGTENKVFFSGNPFVEVTKGIIHMYKKK